MLLLWISHTAEHGTQELARQRGLCKLSGRKDERVEAGAVKDQVALTPALGQRADQDMVSELLSGMALYPH